MRISWLSQLCLGTVDIYAFSSLGYDYDPFFPRVLPSCVGYFRALPLTIARRRWFPVIKANVHSVGRRVLKSIALE